MKKFCQIALFLLIVGLLASCASMPRQVQVSTCHATAPRSSGFERLPF